MVVDELNPIDEPLTETRPLHSCEKGQPFQHAKCFFSMKWLQAIGELQSVAHKDGILSGES